MNAQMDVPVSLEAMPPPPSKGFRMLAELALNIRWSWNHSTDEVWRMLDPTLWEITHNPWVVLRTASREKVESVLVEPTFRKKLDELIQTRHQKLTDPAWFQQKHPGSSLSCAAYFSMEFMLSETLPIYSGGLGNVAGDQLKTASDLGVPVVGVGLLYQQGYFRQVIDQDGTQQALYPYNDPGQLPIQPLRQANGEWLRLEITLPGFSMWVRAWQVQVGRAKLYLLDTNDAANVPAHRGITSELYGGGPELRLRQEMILGIGGWRLLTALGLHPEVCHLNEGHAAFAVLERARQFMVATGLPFGTALEATRGGNLFTTHTAVAAGFDHFEPALFGRHLDRYARERLGIPLHDLMALGRLNPNDPAEHFNMAYLAIRGSGAVNGVSQLHGEVSRRLFAPLFPDWPEEEVPVGQVTNGVHVPTWDSAPADELWTEACGKDRWLGTTENLESEIRRLPDGKIWQLRSTSRQDLVEYARERLSRQLAESGETLEVVEEAKHIFDPNVLTLGFARRFATYKRPDLLLRDKERLLRLLCDSGRPVQLILAGKAHPQDLAGQALIKEWIQFIRRPEVRPHVIFLSDYDMRLTEHLVRGVDVWINTPRRPWEACGTSGMKVLVNGGLNLSELDGWWAEAYNPEVGWALGDGKEHGDDPAWDGTEADALYGLLENEVIPQFYKREKDGLPLAWIQKMRESMARLTPRFSANRAVREYTDKYYLPAAAAYVSRTADKGVQGRLIADWRSGLEQKWAGLRFGGMKTETREGKHHFEVEVFLNGLEPNAVRVELYADVASGGAPFRREMISAASAVAGPGGNLYTLEVSSERPLGDFTARVVPFFPGVAVPLEEGRILWRR